MEDDHDAEAGRVCPNLLGRDADLWLLLQT